MLYMKPSNAVILIVIITVASCIAGFLFPDFSIYSLGFSIAIMLTFFKNDSYTVTVGLISGLYELIAAFYPHRFTPEETIITQHLHSIIQIAIITFLVLFIKRELVKKEADKRYYGSLFESATEGILLVDQETRIILANPAAERLFGFAPEELLGRKISLLIPQRFHARHEGYHASYYSNPETRVMGAGRGLSALRKDGSEFPVEVSLSSFKEKGVTYVIAFIVDITRRKEIEKELLRQKDELETKVEERTLVLKEALDKLEHSQKELQQSYEKEKELGDIKSRFVSMASHEFRTPLSTILSSAELIGQYTRTEDQEKRSRHVLKIKDSVRHLNEILEDFLSIGKLNEGRISRDDIQFNLKDLLYSVKEEVAPVKKQGQQIIIDYFGDAEITSDKKLLRNILINLLSNAIKYSGEHKKIWLSARCNNGSVCLDVKDEGIGISAEDQERLFSTFFRGRNASNIQGTGLGLHIVKRYVDLLEGEIQLTSKLEEGTKVEVVFPLHT